MSAEYHKQISRFKKWAGITLLFTFLVISAGAIVRATGSGMGCPDWPKCFGSWIPPTSEADLPADFRERYKSNEYQNVVFNVYQTWTEYINRLCGAMLGIVALVTAIVGFRIRKEVPVLFWLSVLGLFLIGFEGWLGKTVVESNLAPVKITIHMVVALLIVAVYVFIRVRTGREQAVFIPGKTLKAVLIISLFFTILQVVFGTQVRETVDELAVAMDNRNRMLWPDLLDHWFLIHRSFSILVIGLNLYAYFRLRRSPVWRLMNLIMLVILAEAGLGIIISYLGFPPWAQPLHLILAAVMFGLQFGILTRLSTGTRLRVI